MEPEWLSYAAVADRLGITPEAARSRAKRLRWRRQMSNDGRALVLVALEPSQPGDQPVTPRSSPGRKADASALAHALESHIKTLQSENETLRQQLAAAEGRATQEAEKTSRAIAAFSAIAKSFDALAAERARPWWRRLVG
jgi:hypothetical protein